MDSVASKDYDRLYAECYTTTSYAVTGTGILAYRDVPGLIKKYATGKLTLDYGCGPASSTLFLKSIGLNVHNALDINVEMIKCAKKADPNGKYTVIKSGEIPAPDGYYDIVFTSFALAHLSSKEEILKAVKEIARVLKKGGIVIHIACTAELYKYEFLTDCGLFEENKNLFSGMPVKYKFKDHDFIVDDHYWSDEDYRDILRKADFKILEIQKPLGKDDDGYQWINEKTIAPYIIYVAKKNDGINKSA